MDLKQFVVSPGDKFRFSDCEPGYTGDLTKRDARKMLKTDVKKLRKLQGRLYSQNSYAVLVIVQGLDGSGKDSVIDHVFSNIKPSGYHVVSFKAPSTEELDHDYLWRHFKELPRRGEIVIWNRSHLEEVGVVRVHPELLKKQHLPPKPKKRNIWKRRFEEIRNFEKFLTDNGIVVVKFYLNVSKEEQAKRLVEREDKPSKRWKFSLGDANERQFRAKYIRVYQAAITSTSTKWAPWRIIPGDHKWFTRAVVASTIVKELESLRLHYPELMPEQRREMRLARKMLKKD